MGKNLWSWKKTSGLLMGSLVLLGWWSQGEAPAEDPARPGQRESSWLLPVPELQPDKQIPTLEQIVGHRWAEEISSHSEIQRYLEALARAAPDRCQMVKYGQSYEGKNLWYLIITSPDNLKNIETIRQRNLALNDARKTTVEQATAIAAQAPALVWLSYSVHGDETSPSDGALITAYHLLADQRPQTRELLKNLVIMIDPLQNPDGRDRFIHSYRDRRGSFEQNHPLAAGRIQPWPGGRFNHYLFDMNRDWYMQSQKESQARVANFLRWRPQVFVDAHEMGPDSTFFFDPSSKPYNPHVLPRQREWHMAIGRQHAEQFDQHGFAYTTREMFDGFGPQYGSTWPILHGSIGILWEQAGVRGRVVSRKDKTQLYYHDGVRHHYISGLATLEAALKNRQALLLASYTNSADSLKLGETGPIRGFFLLEEPRPVRAASLAQLLRSNGIEVRRTTASAKVEAKELLADKPAEVTVPAGSYYIPMQQPASRLALTLLERHQDMGAEFISRQVDRVKRGLDDEFYDATSWSLPLAFDLTCLTVSAPVEVASEEWEGQKPSGKIVGKQPRIGYLLKGEDDNLLPALGRWIEQGLRIQVLSEPTRLNDIVFPRGSLLLRVADNPANLHELVADAVKKQGVTVHAVDSAFVQEGAGLGGPNVHWVKPPRVLLVMDEPVDHSVGHTWYLFDQVWRYPVTRIATRSLMRVDWSQFDVCIVPHGNYGGGSGLTEDHAHRLKDWVRDGGTLILVGGATVWATDDKIKLLASKLEPRKIDEDKAGLNKEEKEKKEASQSRDDKEKKPLTDRELPWRVPGIFLKASVTEDHFVTWGINKETFVHYSGNHIFTPLKETDGKNLLVIGNKDPLASGYCWPETLRLLSGKPYVLYRPVGRGHIIGFADDPNGRALLPALQRLFFNAVFFGPSHSNRD